MSSKPPVINPRFKRFVRVKYRIIRAFLAGLALGIAVTTAISLAVLR